MIRLDSIYPSSHGLMGIQYDYGRILWDLLEERDPIANISHRRMPTFMEHCEFIKSRPYIDWWIVAKEGPHATVAVGAAYVSRAYEIGIQIFRAEQRKGYARAALAEILSRFEGQRMLANINPANAASLALFAEFGFKHIQNTYERMT